MRSVIEEIAQAEQQAEEIRQNAAVQARDLTLKARQEAEQAIASLESDARAELQAELETAKQQGEKLSSELLERLQQSFITLAKIEEGRKLLAGVQLNDPIIVTYQKDYAPLEKMGLEKLVTQDE